MSKKNENTMTPYTTYPKYSLPNLVGEAKVWLKSFLSKEKEANLELLSHEVFLAARADVEFEKHKKIIDKNNTVINSLNESDPKRNKLKAENDKIISLYANKINETKPNKKDEKNPLKDLGETPNLDIFKKRLEEYGLGHMTDPINRTNLFKTKYCNLKSQIESLFNLGFSKEMHAKDIKSKLSDYDYKGTLLHGKKYSRYIGR